MGVIHPTFSPAVRGTGSTTGTGTVPVLVPVVQPAVRYGVRTVVLYMDTGTVRYYRYYIVPVLDTVLQYGTVPVQF